MTPTAPTENAATAPETSSLPKATSALPRLHLDFLDGVRGLAALYVVLHHLYLARFTMAAHDHLPASLANSFLYGHLAVSVFLVVSGFCLALPVTQTRQLTGGVLPFFGKRARRILPPFYAALAMSMVIVLFRHHFAAGGPLTKRDFLLNGLLLQDVVPSANTWNAPLWSVAVEWKIYFLFPVFLWIWRKGGTLALLASGLLSGLAATLLWLQFYDVESWGHTCPWFLALFTFGVAAADLARSQNPGAGSWRTRMPWIAGASVLALLALLWQYPVTGRGEGARFVPALPAIDLLTGVAAAALFIIIAHRTREDSPWKRALEWRPLVWIGTFAYSLYLTHEPLIRVWKFALTKLPVVRSSAVLGTFFHMFVGLALLIGAAFVFFLLFERPFLSRRARAALTLSAHSES